MGVYAQAAQYLVKRNPIGFLRWLAPRFLDHFVFRSWLDTSTIAFPGEPDRLCDTVAEFAEAGDPARRLILDVEFQSDPHPDMLERLGEYAYRLRRELRHGAGQQGKYRVVSVLLNLTGPVQPHILDMTEATLDHAGPRLQVVLRTLREEAAAGTLAGIANGELERCVLPWVPLMHGAEESAIIEEWKRLASAEPDSRWRSDYGGLALVFAELADRGPLWRTALEGWNVRQSQQVLEWQEQARQEGRVEGERTMLLRVLERRFRTPVPPDLATAISQTTNPDKLTEWLDLAFTADSLEAFRAAVRA